MNTTPKKEDGSLKDLVKTWGVGDDLVALNRLLELAKTLPSDDVFYQTLAALGLFSRILSKLPREMQSVLAGAQADYTARLQKHVKEIADAVTGLPLQNERQQRAFFRSPECRGLMEPILRSIVQDYSRALKQQITLVDEHRRALDDACVRHGCNLSAYGILCRRMTRLIWVLFGATIVLGGAQLWQWSNDLLGKPQQRIERGFGALGIETRLEREKEGVFVDFDMNANNEGKGIYVRRISPTSLVVGFIKTNAYPPITSEISE
jgi:hypothetical protein